MMVILLRLSGRAVSLSKDVSTIVRYGALKWGSSNGVEVIPQSLRQSKAGLVYTSRKSACEGASADLIGLNCGASHGQSVVGARSNDGNGLSWLRDGVSGSTTGAESGFVSTAIQRNRSKPMANR